MIFKEAAHSSSKATARVAVWIEDYWCNDMTAQFVTAGSNCSTRKILEGSLDRG